MPSEDRDAGLIVEEPVPAGKKKKKKKVIIGIAIPKKSYIKMLPVLHFKHFI